MNPCKTMNENWSYWDMDNYLWMKLEKENYVVR